MPEPKSRGRRWYVDVGPFADSGERIGGGAVVICIEKFAALNSIELSSFNRFCRRVQLAIAVGRCGRHVVGDVCGPRAINYGTPVVLLSGNDAKIFQDYQAPTWCATYIAGGPYN